jgi:DNA repair protein RecO (recombination protein O)
MEITFNTRAVILNKYDFREADSRIVVFSEDFGKMSLILRGAKKAKSKLAGHTEPLTLSRLMVVRGKDFNYAGTAKGENFYANLKDDVDKIFLAGKALGLVDKMTREGEVDEQKEIFYLLEDFLKEIDKEKINILSIQNFFQKLTNILGFSQEDSEELLVA